jgi:RHS repeat-associated protein
MNFTGRPFDAATQLQNNLNRWYDASVGRWLTEDPIGFGAGDPNLYCYVGNDPLTRTDPTGRVRVPHNTCCGPDFDKIIGGHRYHCVFLAEDDAVGLCYWLCYRIAH